MRTLGVLWNHGTETGTLSTREEDRSPGSGGPNSRVVGRISSGGSRVARSGMTRFMSAVEGRPVEKIVRPFQDFAHKESSGGILLIAASSVALLWANSL